MLSLRCARWVAGLLVLSVIVASLERPRQRWRPAGAAGAGRAGADFTIGGNVSGLRR
jgi:hypothetical protein